MEQPTLEEAAAQHEAISVRATALMDADPRLPYISAFVIASDLTQADRSLQWLREGKHPWKMAEAFCGSYGRLDLRVRALEEGLISETEAITDLPGQWSGSDPDDTDPRFLALWKSAVRFNGGKYLRDGKPLPRRRHLVVYRGQDEGAPFGIAWSLDANIARKFANGAATRQHQRNGVVYHTMVRRIDVLGYMTGRGEAEVVLDPASLLATPVVLR